MGIKRHKPEEIVAKLRQVGPVAELPRSFDLVFCKRPV